jgi:hypothetical protein
LLSFYVVGMADESITMTLRLDPQEVEFLDHLAESFCNTRAGMIRYAIKSLKTAAAPGSEPAALPALKSQTEEAA